VTAPPRDSVCLVLVSLRSMQSVALLAELSRVEMQAADFGSACLKAVTSKRFTSLLVQTLGSERSQSCCLQGIEDQRCKMGREVC
jgi:hypothetical protein